MGILHQNRDEVPIGIKKAKLKWGRNMPVYKHKLMTMQWEDKKVTSVSGDHDDKMVPNSV